MFLFPFLSLKATKKMSSGENKRKKNFFKSGAGRLLEILARPEVRAVHLQGPLGRELRECREDDSRIRLWGACPWLTQRP